MRQSLNSVPVPSWLTTCFHRSLTHQGTSDFQSVNLVRRERTEERSFRSDWCTKFPWLHYNVGKDVALCHVCMKAEFEKKSLASTKRDSAFITRGFSCWKDGSLACTKHQTTATHGEVVAAAMFSEQVKDVGVKSYLRSTLGQARLNHLMFLSVHKDMLDGLCLKSTANEFVRGSEHRLSRYGKF